MSTLEAVDRTITLIEQLAEHPRGLGVLKLAEYVGLAPSTAHRYLSTLKNHKLVEQDGNKLYILTPRLYLLGLAAGAGFDLETQAQGALQRLAQASQETSCLMVRDGKHSVCVSQIDSHHQLKIAARVGGRQDLRVGATSRVLLAYAPEPIQVDIFNQDRISRYTSNTITETAKVRKILERIRHDGYYVSCGEVDEGVIAVAAPVRDRTKEVIAALAIAAPESRIRKPESLDSIIRLVTTEADELSIKLGFSGTNAHTTERSFT